MKELVNAKKRPLGQSEALAVTQGIDRIIAAKGTKLVTIDLKKDRPSPDELLAVLLGPTGNLRAPTIRKGKTLMVGFNADVYERLLAK